MGIGKDTQKNIARTAQFQTQSETGNCREEQSAKYAKIQKKYTRTTMIMQSLWMFAGFVLFATEHGILLTERHQTHHDQPI